MALNCFYIAWLALSFLHSSSSDTSSITALSGAKIYTKAGTAPIENGIVLIRDGKILNVGPSEQVKVPSNARTIDCKGLTMVPGFWNCHVHFMERKWENAANIPKDTLAMQMQQMFTRYGFTRVFDLATLDFQNLLALRARMNKDGASGPDILLKGVPFAPPHASPFYISPYRLPCPSNESECRAHVLSQLNAGVDAIKIWSASPTGNAVIPMPLSFVKSACTLAHESGKKVFAHPSNLEGVRIAAQGGVDILAHVAADDHKDFDNELLGLMHSSDMALIPTLKLHAWDLLRAGIDTTHHPLLQTALQQLRTFYQRNGKVIFGTDVGYMTDYSPEDEYVLMARAGMTFDAILASMTVTPAKEFGFEASSGTIDVGKDADLVLLAADPVSNMRHLTKVVYTMRKGNIIYSSDSN